MKLVRRGTTVAVWVVGAIVLLAIIAITVVGAYFGGKWLWGEIAGYIAHGNTPEKATQRKDVVNLFVLIGAGIVGTLNALAALLNAHFTRKNLQNARETLHQARELDERRAQDDALQAYLAQMGELLTQRGLKEAEPASAVSLLARAQTLTVLERLEERHKRDVLRFVYGAGLIHKDRTVLNLAGAYLVGAMLIAVDLKEANLEDVELRDADLTGADLIEANLSRARFTHANLRTAMLIGADLTGADLTGAELGHASLNAADLRGALLFGAVKLSGGRRRKVAFADLRDAYLGDADLTGVFLMGAKLENANLMGADLSDANLAGVTGWTFAQLMEAKSLRGAIMPAGEPYEDWLKGRESRGQYVTTGQETYADHLKMVRDISLSFGQKTYLDWLRDREEGRGDETEGRSPFSSGSYRPLELSGRINTHYPLRARPYVF